MRVPRLSAWAQNLCGMQFSILGYGDIIVPGEKFEFCVEKEDRKNKH